MEVLTTKDLFLGLVVVIVWLVVIFAIHKDIENKTKERKKWER